MVEVDGIVTSIVYKNDDNGYTVAKIKCEQDMENYSIVGYMHYLSEGQRVHIKGEWTYHKSFGKQIKVDSFEEILPTTLEGVEKYLASGLINGIGPVTAKKIIKAFGEKALDIIEMNPERLTEVEGIGSRKAKKIGESLKEQRELKEIMIFLQSHGITPSYGIKIFKKYGAASITVLRENPYSLCEDIQGIGFKTADKIAKSLGMNVNSPFRIASGIKYVLSTAVGNGHVYLPKEECIKKSAAELKVDASLIGEGINTLNLNRDIVVDEVEEVTCIYLSPMFFSEVKSAKKIVELTLNRIDVETEKVDIEIKDFEKENNISFAPEQIDAIKEGVKNGVCVITGGPGTGKTTIIKCIIKIFENRSLNVCLCAPTGRAAKRMSESTGYEAKTIHRLLQVEFISDSDRNTFAKDENEPIEADVIIVDEASMIDVMLMNSLLKAMSSTTRLILVGDVDQLPSVGPGNVLLDIIESGGIAVARLQHIFRQSMESLITINAHKINNGDMPILNEKDKDFFFLQNNSADGIIKEIANLVNVRLPKFKKDLDRMKDIQVLSPMKKGEAGIIHLNNALQEILNPKSPSKTEKKVGEYILRVGDKVMQTKNNYQLTWESLTIEGEEGSGIFNGDIGYIERINTEDSKAYIIFDEDKRVEYDFSSLDEIELAYAITIHKSQGSEFPVCIIPVFYGPPMLMTRNLIYTGVTRAKSFLVLIGVKQTLSTMIKNKTITKRYSSLKNRIKNFCEVIK
ncbi:ATP-dependent RecD-like DNA helicase [Clostridium cylindrosporum]|uniref:ATP-dependent RecD2 DNA helicase n=1 Tax=Clostridium cylindrosporum DSM 605 TaxID=1121307 RepID=A0A0J8DGR2_CLOCY|nr:ATP-dependent RecD-like DNA helicase [Clostridium cylindrosporum]KMT23383.1 helicase, putative, RecD/TraA family [Clostridium cylindrosporum DSM 605]